jgi:mono/diheme cytochrome c family protein
MTQRKGSLMRLRWMLLTLPLLGACTQEEAPSGAEDFVTYCAACHGTSGTGNGPGAEGLAKRPADLTQLSARNGGAFPGTRVMAKIYGYTGRDSASAMPQFGPLLQGDLVPYDGGDGIATPTPVRLVQLAEYLKTLQK